MLEIRNIQKTYRSKTGESVRALDDVSIKFPASGMVFLLGKSGSGKSTLLNVIGGLDSYDSGEFIIMGKSSKDFGGSDFDAYRNTFIGFIFQEYNVLDEFTVGANIGLALELQGKKATSEKIDEILRQVDLAGYGHRKPNELSGGQKQRVAIARALVKEPQIIMADEPTGALDSKTGKQIFDTLKNLSKEKLVLVVSHDRDFAERYADRIIELSDGHIVSDVTKHEIAAVQVNEGIERMGGKMLRIKRGYTLTPADLDMINAYLAGEGDDILFSADERVNEELRSAAGITKDGSTAVFEETAARDVKTDTYEGKKTRFIRSRLPMKNAVRIGASGLKHKKFRLVLTIFLSLIAFGLFGLSDTMAAYQKITAATESIVDSRLKTAAVALGVRTTYYVNGEAVNGYYSEDTMNEGDLARLARESGIAFVPVFNGTGNTRNNIPFSSQFLKQTEQYSAYPGSLCGFVTLDEATLAAYGFTLTGRMPAAADEIVITEHTYRQFKEYGFRNTAYEESVRADQLNTEADSPYSIFGKHLSLYIDRYNDTGATDLVIVGVLDTAFEYDRYARFLPIEEGAVIDTNEVTDMLLSMELSDTLAYGFHCLAVVSPERMRTWTENASFSSWREVGTYLNGWHTTVTYTPNGTTNVMSHDLYRVSGNAGLADLTVRWVDGTPRQTLGDGEIVISSALFENYAANTVVTIDLSPLEEKARALWGTDYDETASDMALLERFRDASHKKHGNGDCFEEELLTFKGLVADFYGVEIPDTLTRESLLHLMEDMLCLGGDTPYYNFAERRSRAILTIEIEREKLYENEDFVAAMCKIWGNGSDYPAGGSVYARVRYLADPYYYFVIESTRNANNPYGAYNAATLQEENYDRFLALGGISLADVADAMRIVANRYDWSNGESNEIPVSGLGELRVVGFYRENGNMRDDYVVSETLLSRYRAFADAEGYSIQEVASHESGAYAFAIAPMPKDTSGIERLVKMHYTEGEDLRFSLHNHVMNTLDNFSDFIEIGAKIFLWVGVGFAVFASLLLMNFIAVSISYKKREIGILRAVGARSSDVFKIFFSESLIIALINFSLSVGALLVTIFSINKWMRSEGINVTLLHFGVRQFILMLLVSVAVALIASFLPVYKIARRRPVDAIKDR